jgi:hypothetical protein
MSTGALSFEKPIQRIDFLIFVIACLFFDLIFGETERAESTQF